MEDPKFRRAARSARLLQYTVEEALAGRVEQIKESVLGVEVFDRGAAFDPRIDAIVRVEARRLRMRLESYYAGSGQGDPVRIEYQRGSYVPAFRYLGSPERHEMPVLPKRRPRWPVFLAAGVLAAALLAYFGARIVSELRRPSSVAVLPFEIESAIPRDSELAAGLRDGIVNGLSSAAGLRVLTGRPGSKTGTDSRTLGQRLGSDAVLEGSLRRDGERIRVSARLIRVRDGTVLWTEVLEHSAISPFELEDRSAHAIAAAVGRKLGVGPIPARVHSRDPEARRLYQLGRYAWSKRTEVEVLRSIALFREALQRDPDYALAHAGLADSLLSAASRRLVPPAEGIPAARESVRKALAMAPRLAEALSTSARIRFFHDWQFAAAEAEFRRAMDLAPSYPLAHQWHGLALAVLGRFDEALAHLREAESLDPLLPVIGNDVAITLVYQRRYDLAAEQARRVIEYEPNFYAAHITLGYALASQGQAEQALREMDRAVELAGDDHGARLWRVRAMALLGQRERALAQLAEIQRTIPERINVYRLAAVWATLGQREKAFAALEQAFQDREQWLVFCNVDPAFDALRLDPRFPALLRRIGLAR